MKHVVCRCGKTHEFDENNPRRFCDKCGAALDIQNSGGQESPILEVSEEAKSPNRGYYPPPPPPPAKSETSGLALASFILSLTGLLTCGVTSIIGLILGIVSLSQFSGKPSLQGKGFAIAGVIISGVVILLAILYIVFVVIVFSSAATIGMNYSNQAQSYWAASGLREIYQAQNLYYSINGTYGTFADLQNDTGLSTQYVEGGTLMYGGYEVFMDQSVTKDGFTCLAKPDGQLSIPALRVTENGVVEKNDDYDSFSGGNWEKFTDY